MPLTRAEIKKRYETKRDAARRAMSPIPCACGCGTLIPPITTGGDRARYARFHNNRTNSIGKRAWNRLLPDRPLTPAERQRRATEKRKARIAQMEPVPCQCGCRRLMPPLTTTGRTRRFISGHQPGKNQSTRFQKGQHAWNKGRPAPWSTRTHLGRKASIATRLKISAAGKGRPAWNKGRAHPTNRQGATRSTALGGFRPDLGEYFRSRWEANYARYLRAHDIPYVYEPACYIINMPDGTTHAYRPDFLVDEKLFVELRGPFGFDIDVRDAVLREALHQLPHPLKVIRADEYGALHRRCWATIRNWECERDPIPGIEGGRKPCLACGGPMNGKPRNQKYCRVACRPNNPFQGRKHSKEAIQKRTATRIQRYGQYWPKRGK